MRMLLTTESQLVKILESPDNDVWHQILKRIDTVVISTTNSNDDDWDYPTDSLRLFHKEGHKVVAHSPLINNLPTTPRYIEGCYNDIMLLDIDKNKAASLSNNYGVCIFSSQNNDIPYIANNGFTWENPDTDHEPSWNCFFDNMNINGSSAVIIDRYLYSSEWNKGNDDPDDSIADSDYNLREILNNIIPQNIMKNSKYVVTIIFSSTEIKGGRRDYHEYSFSDVVSRIERIKQTINRPFQYDIEVIAINKGCPYYNDTHDRFIISNFFITEATHKLKAFNNRGEFICKQKIDFNYIFSRGISPKDKSSLPLKTMERVIDAIITLTKGIDSEAISFTDIKSGKTWDRIEYAFNGIVSDFDISKIKNPLLKKNK